VNSCGPALQGTTWQAGEHDGMGALTPEILIHQGEAGIDISQQRPTVTGLLAGMSLEEAVIRIPLLLPICGKAQGVAAQRAASAARGEPEPFAEQHTEQLWREQALAAAWRLAIDWPGLVGRQKEIALLKAAQQAADPESLATELLDFLPALITVDDVEQLIRWLEQSDCTAAEVIRRAQGLEFGIDAPHSPRLAAGQELQGLALAAMARDPFDPQHPAGAGVEVGPLAMCRHPLIEQLWNSEVFGALSRRLVALVLDTLVIAGHLLDAQTTYPLSAWTLGGGVGLGRANTARGPVFHRVVLGDDNHVLDWRVLAPTDWHFAANGPLAHEASRLGGDSDRLALLVAGFDPCAPWSIAEASHA
jgi:hypothetical protein